MGRPAHAGVTRVRTALEGSRGFILGGGLAFSDTATGPVAAGARADGGGARGRRVHRPRDVAVVRVGPVVEPAGPDGEGGPVVGRRAGDRRSRSAVGQPDGPRHGGGRAAAEGGAGNGLTGRGDAPAGRRRPRGASRGRRARAFMASFEYRADGHHVDDAGNFDRLHLRGTESMPGRRDEQRIDTIGRDIAELRDRTGTLRELCPHS